MTSNESVAVVAQQCYHDSVEPSIGRGASLLQTLHMTMTLVYYTYGVCRYTHVWRIHERCIICRK